MVDDTRKQTSNMLTQLKNGQRKEGIVAVLSEFGQVLCSKERASTALGERPDLQMVCKLEQDSLPDRRDQCAGQNGLWHQALAACDKSIHVFLVHVCLAHCSALQVSAGCYAGDA